MPRREAAPITARRFATACDLPHTSRLWLFPREQCDAPPDIIFAEHGRAGARRHGGQGDGQHRRNLSRRLRILTRPSISAVHGPHHDGAENELSPWGCHLSPGGSRGSSQSSAERAPCRTPAGFGPDWVMTGGGTLARWAGGRAWVRRPDRPYIPCYEPSGSPQDEPSGSPQDGGPFVPGRRMEAPILRRSARPQIRRSDRPR